MSTRSTIAVQHDNGKVSAVYCHFDGYLEGVGAKLSEYFSEPTTAQALVALGDLSCVKSDIGACVAYHRDRGEPFDQVKPHEYANREEYLTRSPNEIDDNGYRYFFADGEWLVWGRYEGATATPKPLKPLLNAIDARSEG